MRDTNLTGTEALSTVALRHGITAARAPNSWRVRAIIAAHRDNNNLALRGLGYGPDWIGYIKQDVRCYLANGTVPYVVHKMATAYWAERQAAAACAAE